MAWTAIADALPDSDMSGDVTVYEVYDGTDVYLTGRFNDQWMLLAAYGPPTHYQLWAGSEPPTVEPEIWHAVADEGDPQPEFFFALYEIFDGDSTGLNARFGNSWIAELPITHWKLPTLSDPPAP